MARKVAVVDPSPKVKYPASMILKAVFGSGLVEAIPGRAVIRSPEAQMRIPMKIHTVFLGKKSTNGAMKKTGIAPKFEIAEIIWYSKLLVIILSVI